MQNESVLEINEYETKRWRLNGELHREDGPAVEFANGDKRWYLNGKKHRTDGPAVELVNGGKYWYLNDELHRTDGPAVELSNSYKEWHLYGTYYTFDVWLKLTPLSNKEKIKLRLKYGQ